MTAAGENRPRGHGDGDTQLHGEVDEPAQRGPFTRPGFLGAGVLVAALVAGGVWLSVTAPSGPTDPAAPAGPSVTAPVFPTPPQATTAAASETSAAAGASAATSPTTAAVTASDSVCGLPGSQLDGTVSRTPTGDTWVFEGRTAYPVSPAAGPGSQSRQGWRSCFARTPEGVVHAAAYAVAIGSSSDYARKLSWARYGLADSPIPRADRVKLAVGEASSTSSRIDLLGFRLLNYDGSSAQVEVALRVALTDRTGYYGAVYPLRWEDGDWKVYLASADNPFGLVQVPDLTGYVPWSQPNG